MQSSTEYGEQDRVKTNISSNKSKGNYGKLTKKGSNLFKIFLTIITKQRMNRFKQMTIQTQMIQWTFSGQYIHILMFSDAYLNHMLKSEVASIFFDFIFLLIF